MSKSRLLLPRRLVLVRHGESQANVDRSTYSRVPDWKIELTEKGQAQASECGARLRSQILRDVPTYFYVSPYVRARQTLNQILRSFPAEQIVGVREDERIREQEMGNFQPIEMMDHVWKEREVLGRFHYRFPGGENGADVADRVSSFLDSLFRERQGLRPHEERFNETNVVIVCHGLFLRLFIGRWYKLPLEVFEKLHNPPNCCACVLTRDDAKGRLVMDEESKELFGHDPMLRDVRFDGTDNGQWYQNHILDIAKTHAPTDFASPS
jgi:broad specificity phosphatase PhoE